MRARRGAGRGAGRAPGALEISLAAGARPFSHGDGRDASGTQGPAVPVRPETGPPGTEPGTRSTRGTRAPWGAGHSPRRSPRPPRPVGAPRRALRRPPCSPPRRRRRPRSRHRPRSTSALPDFLPVVLQSSRLQRLVLLATVNNSRITDGEGRDLDTVGLSRPREK